MDKKIKHPSEFLSLEDKIDVVILDLDVEGRKLAGLDINRLKITLGFV